MTSEQFMTPTGQELQSLKGKLDSAVDHPPSFTERELAILRHGLVEKGRTYDPTGPKPGTGQFRAVRDAAQENGYCYLLFLLACPSLSFADPVQLMGIMQEMKASLGKFPTGQSLLPSISAANIFLNGRNTEHYDEIVLMYRNQPHTFIESLKELMNSNVRLQHTIENDVIHLSTSLNGPCDCPDTILCDHGFYMRYLISIATAPGYTVGGDLNIDFSQLFVDDNDGDAEPSDSESDTIQPLRYTKNRTHRDSGVGMNDEQVSALKSEPLNQHHHHARKLRKAMGDIDQVCDDRGKKPLVSELSPGDSPSILGRHGRRYMDQGTVLSLSRNMEQVDELGTDLGHNMEINMPTGGEVQRYRSDLNLGNIQFANANGYILTPSMIKADGNSRSKLTVINGLAQPFKNRRLNLLIHIHTALKDKAGKHQSCVTLFKSFRSYKPTNPTEMLLAQLVERTFDFREMTVISNPFNLPFIELGMIVSEATLQKLVDLLKNEYELAWFSEMKNLVPPDFSQRYVHLSEGLLMGNWGSHQETRKDKIGSSGTKVYYKDKRKSSKGSILGF